MTTTPPGHYRVWQPFLTGGCQVRLVCRHCWHQFDVQLDRQPRTDRGDTLRGRCPQCNKEQVFGPHA